MIFVFFFKQKTAYEMRISDWSSDVCSSDLIAVSGLNPHAGDGGSIGMEEIEVIEPAVKKAQAMGMDARGPYSPDTIFIAARRGDFDAIVSMYHDQGQIAMKLIGFDHGVTLRSEEHKSELQSLMRISYAY